MTALVADPSWCAQVRDEGLVVHAGADSVYLLPDLAPPVAAELAALFGEPEARVVPDGLSAEARLLLPQLRGIGAPAALGGDAARDGRRRGAGRPAGRRAHR